MRVRYYIVLLHFVVLISCGGTAESKSAAESVIAESEEAVVDIDAMLGVMDARYNALCEERRVALNERDAERRRTLLEVNDSACAEFKDSLEWLLQMQR